MADWLTFHRGRALPDILPPPVTPAPPDISNGPVQPRHYAVFEAPRFLNPDPTIRRFMIVAIRANPGQAGAFIIVRAGTTITRYSKVLRYQLDRIWLVEDMGYTDKTIKLTSPPVGNLLYIEGEFIRITGRDVDNKTYTVERALGDSVPVTASANTIVFDLRYRWISDSISGAVWGVDYKILSFTDEYRSVADRYRFETLSISPGDWRVNSPPAPADVRLNGVYYPSTVRNDIEIKCSLRSNQFSDSLDEVADWFGYAGHPLTGGESLRVLLDVDGWLLPAYEEPDVTVSNLISPRTSLTIDSNDILRGIGGRVEANINLHMWVEVDNGRGGEITSFRWVRFSFNWIFEPANTLRFRLASGPPTITETELSFRDLTAAPPVTPVLPMAELMFQRLRLPIAFGPVPFIPLLPPTPPPGDSGWDHDWGNNWGG